MRKIYLEAIFCFWFLFSGICPAQAFEFDDFLGTMGGKQIYRKSSAKDGQETYSRLYAPFGPMDLRVEVSKASFAGFKSIGEEYSFTPLCLRDGRPFGCSPTLRRGGGFLKN